MSRRRVMPRARRGERSRSGGGVTVEVVTPIEEFHGFFRYSFVWKIPDGTLGPGTDFCEVADDGRCSSSPSGPAASTSRCPNPAAGRGCRHPGIKWGRTLSHLIACS